jgi:hypothetical protein
MFCPRCEAEFRSGFTLCSDCDVPLVDALPEAPVEAFDAQTDLGDLVPLRKVSEPALLPVLTSLLESEDIPFFVQGETALRTVGFAQLLRGADPDNVHWVILVPATLVAKANAALTAALERNVE